MSSSLSRTSCLALFDYRRILTSHVSQEFDRKGAERIARSISVTGESDTYGKLSAIAEMLLHDQHEEAWELGRGSCYAEFAHLAVRANGLG